MNAIQVGAVLVSVHVWDNRLDPTLDSFVDHSIYIISDTFLHCNITFWSLFPIFWNTSGSIQFGLFSVIIFLKPYIDQQFIAKQRTSLSH